MRPTKMSFFFMLLVCFACSSTDELQVIEGVGQMQDSPEGYEDCGWVINLEGQFYKPSYVPSQYRVEGLEVFISLEDLYTEENCQSAGNTLIGGRIIQISQR